MSQYVVPDTGPMRFEIKRYPGDFEVVECRETEPTGSGEHLHLWVRKTSLTTDQAVRALGRALGRPVKAFGVCGQKDKRAITSQWISVQGADPSRLANLHSTQLEVLRWQWDRSKLRRGAHGGNRFVVLLRDLDPTRKEEVETVLRRIAASGLPNFFGPQRYGFGGVNVALGRALLRGDVPTYLALYLSPEHILGQPSMGSKGDCAEDPSEPVSKGSSQGAFSGSRPDPEVGTPEMASLDALRSILDAKEKGEWRQALDHVAGLPTNVVEIAKQMVRRPLDVESLLRAIPKAELRMGVHALQSAVFDTWLKTRMRCGDWTHAVAGDVLGIAGNRDSTWAIGGEPVLQPSGHSALGPLFGASMSMSKEVAFELEEEVLAEVGLARDDFQAGGPADPKGARRPMLAPVTDLKVEWGGEWEGEGCRLHFALPPGSYATSFWRN